MYDIRNKIIFITGACGGIGFETSKEFLRRQAKGISLIDINENDGMIRVKELENEFGANKAIFIKTDVGNPSSLKHAFDETIKHYKHLDIVINNAGIINEIDWRQCININLKGVMEGTYLGLKTYLPKYKSAEEGVIINISSMICFNITGTVSAYTSTKYGIIGLGRTLGVSKYNQKYKTKVLTLCPGNTITNIFDDVNENGNFEETLEIIDSFEEVLPQDPTSVAKTICYMVEKGTHGEFWGIESNVSYKIEFNPIKRVNFPNFKL